MLYVSLSTVIIILYSNCLLSLRAYYDIVRTLTFLMPEYVSYSSLHGRSLTHDLVTLEVLSTYVLYLLNEGWSSTVTGGLRGDTGHNTNVRII